MFAEAVINLSEIKLKHFETYIVLTLDNPLEIRTNMFDHLGEDEVIGFTFNSIAYRDLDESWTSQRIQLQKFFTNNGFLISVIRNNGFWDLLLPLEDFKKLIRYLYSDLQQLAGKLYEESGKANDLYLF